MNKKELMMRAIRLSEESVRNGGGPFGAVIAKNGEIVAEASNCVTINCDPTAHAEVSAIRAAAKKMGTFNLSGCEIFTSCEPCPMCLGAIYWARLHHLYFAATQHDAAEANFDDAFIYREIALPHSLRHLPTERMTTAEAGEPFRLWNAKTDKVAY